MKALGLYIHPNWISNTNIEVCEFSDTEEIK